MSTPAWTLPGRRTLGEPSAMICEQSHTGMTFPNRAICTGLGTTMIRKEENYCGVLEDCTIDLGR